MQFSLPRGQTGCQVVFFDDGSLELYDLAKDISEKNNLAANLPDRAAKMQAQLQAWRKETNAAMPSRIESD